MVDRDTSVDTALDQLRSPGRPLPWTAPDQIRERGRGRRRRATVLRSTVATVVAATVTVTVVVVTRPERQHGSTHTAEPIATNLQVRDRAGSAVELAATDGTGPAAPNSSAGAVTAGAEVDFALKLLRKLQGKRSNNVLVSPSSLSTALAMLNYGARGRTQRQIAALLGPPGSSARSIASGWSTIVAAWAKAAAAEKIALTSANSVWLQRNAPLVASFTDALAAYFNSGVWQVDFAGDPDKAARDLNAWVSRETHGKIPSLVTSQQVEGLLLVLVNAVYFKADWAAPFGDTLKARFTTAAGHAETVDMMSDGIATATLATPGVQAAQLPYRGGRFAALLIQPRHASLNSYVNSLSASDLAGLVRQLRPNPMAVSMPQLDMKANNDLKPALRALGMRDAFEEGHANLLGLSPLADYVAFVIQKATLAVTPRGTTATAATAIGVAVTSAHVGSKNMRFDHPFLFLIRDVQTGAILFSAQINDPLAH